MTRVTEVPAIGGGVMVRGAGGRFVAVLRDAVPVGAAVRVIDGQVFTVTVLPDAPVPAWCAKSRPVGKGQHGKRRGARHGERDHAAYRAYRLSVA